MCRGFPPHQQAILKHQESPTGLLLAPHTHFRCQSKIQIITWASDQLAINQRVPWEGSVNLLELLTEGKHWLTLNILLKQMVKETGEHQDGENAQGEADGKGHGGLCPLWVHHSPRTYLEVLWTPHLWVCEGFITKVWLIINSVFSPVLFSRGWSWKFQASNYGLVFLATSRHPGVQPESPHWNKRHSHHPGNYRSFTNSVSGKVVKDQN